MNFLGLNLQIKNIPELDAEFIPLAKFKEAFEKSVGSSGKPFKIAVERENSQVAAFDLSIHGTPEMKDADYAYIERYIKMILWSCGGFRIYLAGDDTIINSIKEAYSATGARKFDRDNMTQIYEKDFEVISCSLDKIPAASNDSKSIGRHLNGCRIGFDAGGSDRKVSAVVDGEAIWSEEVVWHPKTNSDPDYHFEGIVAAMKSAAEKMPRVDAIGVSSAGVYVNNRTMLASLFLKVSKEDFDTKVKDIYIRAAKEIGDVPLIVANDGDVTALAGAMSLKDNSVLGIAMGTSEAAGFVDGEGNITGWLNELAFCPVDLAETAMVDEWSGDRGCGVKYFSQDGINKLAPRAGIELDENATPAEKLKVTQKLMNEGDSRAAAVYRSTGVYLGHSLAWYSNFYDMKHVLLLGRVMSGNGGDLIIEYANKVLNEEYPELAKTLSLDLPDEAFRRVGQSVAAASLPYCE